MSTLQIVRAWKDQSYRNTPSSEDLAGLPANPAGTIELEPAPVSAQTNGKRCQTPPSTYLCTFWCGPIYTVWRSMGGSTCA